MGVKRKMNPSALKSAIVIGLVVFVAACGGSGGEPTAEIGEVDSVATAVKQTLDARAVALTIEALTTPGVLPTPEVQAAPVQPTTAALPTATPIPLPTTAPPIAEATTAPPTATLAPPTATATRANLPPNVENDAPGGSFPEDGTVFFNIIVDPVFLFRMDVRDNTVDPNVEGAGIDSVGFSISGNGIDYFREERTAGFCVFGGGEPTCNPWPRNEFGQLTWGAGGPVVQSGEYFVNMTVTADRSDDDFGGNWNWNFNFRVTVP